MKTKTLIVILCCMLAPVQRCRCDAEALWDKLPSMKQYNGHGSGSFWSNMNSKKASMQYTSDQQEPSEPSSIMQRLAQLLSQKKKKPHGDIHISAS